MREPEGQVLSVQSPDATDADEADIHFVHVPSSFLELTLQMLPWNSLLYYFSSVVCQ